jgi:hypothetical protein
MKTNETTGATEMRVKNLWDVSDSTGKTIVPSGMTGTVVRMIDSGLSIPDVLVRWDNGVETQDQADDVEPVE